MAHLLDSNALIALFADSHVHHRAVRNWFVHLQGPFATCAVVEGAFVRWLVRLHGRDGVGHAQRELGKLAADPRHRFWAGNLSYRHAALDGVLGHRQVTDAWLAALARQHGGRLATLDRGLAAMHHDVADLIPNRTEDPT